MRLFDSHSHLQDARFDEDRESVLARAAAAGVEAVVVCGEDVESSRTAVALAEQGGAQRPRLLPTVGFHPHEAARATGPALDEIETLARSAPVAAIGEIGLDFYRTLAPPPVQRDAFEAQLAIAARLGLPVSIHSRDAEEEIAPHLSRYAAESPLAAAGQRVGVLHAFGGTLEQARRYVEMGFFISLTCSAGYPRNDEARRVAAGLPLTALLIETDSPALPPQARRGTRNEPAHVRVVAEVVAEARGVSVEAVANATTANGEALLGGVRDLQAVEAHA